MDLFEMDWAAATGGANYMPSESYKPSYTYSAPSYDYSLSSGYSSGGTGLKAPTGSSSYGLTYTPGQTSSLGLSYSPSYTPTFNVGSGTNYGLTSAHPTGGGTNSGAWWDVAPSYSPSFTAGSGVQMPVQSADVGGAQLRAGSGTPGLQLGSGAPGVAVQAAPAQSGIAGGFGVTPQSSFAQAPSMLEDPLTPTQRAMLTQTGAAQGDRGVLQQASDWLRDPKNRDVVRLGIQGIGALAGLRNQNMANQQIQQELQRSNQAYASQVQANQQNQAIAQRLNQEAVQSLDEARSLYNPQELAIRGLAQTRGTTQRNIAEMRRELARKGLSPAAIEAEVRRAQVAGAAGESTAYAQGLDLGRTAQQGALTAAKGLTQSVPGLQYTPSASVANYYAQQGTATSKTLQDMLESYLGYPTLQSQEEIRRQMQQGSV